MKKIEVVAAIVICGDEILCVQRPKSKLPYISEKFEFPGGKIEQGETKKGALKREMMEELNVNPYIDDLYLTVVHQYPDFELTMHSFLCKLDDKSDIVLHEHIDQQWLSKEALINLDWAEADIPIVKKLMGNE